MGLKPQEIIEKESLTLREVWPKLTDTQKRWVAAYQKTESIAAAAREAGCAPQTAYNWGDLPRIAAHLFADQVAHAAMIELEDAVVEAARIKVQEVRDPGTTQKTQQDAATEILDRVLGRPIQSSQVAMKGELSHTTPSFYLPKNGREGEGE